MLGAPILRCDKDELLHVEVQDQEGHSWRLVRDSFKSLNFVPFGIEIYASEIRSKCASSCSISRP